MNEDKKRLARVSKSCFLGIRNDHVNMDVVLRCVFVQFWVDVWWCGGDGLYIGVRAGPFRGL